MAIFGGRKRRIGERVKQISSNEETGKRKETEGENQGFPPFSFIRLAFLLLLWLGQQGFFFFFLCFCIFPPVKVFDAALFCPLLLPPER
ncbi:unnamed protein product [Musa textilis]